MNFYLPLCCGNFEPQILKTPVAAAIPTMSWVNGQQKPWETYSPGCCVSTGLWLQHPLSIQGRFPNSWPTATRSSVLIWSSKGMAGRHTIGLFASRFQDVHPRTSQSSIYLSMQDCLLPSPGGVTHTATAPVGITPVTSAHGASTWLSPRQDPLIQMRGWVNPLFVYLGTLGPAGSLPHATSGTYAHTAWRHIRPRSVH
jgi:hypothetical protein